MSVKNKHTKKILVLGDIHLPWPDWTALEQAAEWARKERPDYVVMIGDLTDQKNWSRFGTDPDDDSPEQEWEKVEQGAKRLAKLFPKMQIIAGNHCRRYLKKASEARLSSKMVKSPQELLPYKGWTWHLDPSKTVMIDNVVFMHGDELGGAVEAKAAVLGLSVTQGHSHKSRIVYHNTFNHQVFGMDVGCMVDPSAPGFRYAAGGLRKVWIGFGVIDKGVPSLIPKKV